VAGIKREFKNKDQATAALIKDLTQRGLLEETIVIRGGESGRTLMVQSDPNSIDNMGRDHHNKAFAMYFAGGGFKSGTTIGEPDELGFNAITDSVHIHNLQATLLHLLGIDHTKLTYHFQRRDSRFTDVYGEVVNKLLA
jgi:arylsulfatase A-like enzyme